MRTQLAFITVLLTAGVVGMVRMGAERCRCHARFERHAEAIAAVAAFPGPVTPTVAASDGRGLHVRALIESGTTPEREQAASWLATQPMPEARLLPYLFVLIGDPAPSVRRDAARALLIVPDLGPEGAVVLRDLLRDTDVSVRSLAAAGLGSRRTRGDAAVVDALLVASRDAVQEVRWTALESLASHFKDRPKAILAAWVRGLDDPSDDVKSISANCLEGIGPAGRPAAHALEAAMLKVGDPFLEWEISDALTSVVGR